MKSSIDDKNKIAILIKDLRKQHRLTQQELADQAGVSFSFVNQVERGKKTVRLDTLNQLLAVFGYEMSPSRISRNHP